MAESRKAALYGADGDEKGEVSLDPATFGLTPNPAVMHQVVTAQLAAARRGTASTKTRAEVRGGGAKPWRQKGLGRARHGSIRSPIWAGGGVAHGPKPRSYAQATPKKMKKLALRSALSARAAEQQVKVVEKFEWSEPKTKAAADLLAKIGVDSKAVVVLSPDDGVAALALRNLPTVVATESGQLTTYDVLWADTVVFTSQSLALTDGTGKFDVTAEDFVREAPTKDEAE